MTISRSSSKRSKEVSLNLDDSDDDEVKPVEKSAVDKFLNYLFCRGDLAKQTLKLQPVAFTALFRYAERREYFLLALGCLCAILSGACQPVLAMVSGGIFNLMLVSNVTSPEFRGEAYKYVYAYTGMGIGITIINFINFTCFDMVCSRLQARTRVQFIKSILRQNAGWYDKNHAGALITQLNDNMDRIREGVGDKLGLLIRGLSMFVCSLIIAFSIEWRVALFMSMLAPAVCTCMSIMARKLSSSTAKELKDVGSAGAIAEESVLGVRTVQAFNGQQEMLDRYRDSLGKGQQHALRKSFWSGFFGGFFFFILQAYLGCAILFGGYLLRIGVVPEPGQVFTVVMAMMVSAYFLGLISPQLLVLLNSRVAAAIVYKTIDRTPRIDAYSNRGETPPSASGRIEFKNVHFRYPTRRDTKVCGQVLNSFMLKIEPGETVAFVGHSGCGKSTAVGLLTRLYEAERGEVLVDGHEVRTLNLQWLRQHIGIVQQEPILFNDTIADNLRLGNPDMTLEDMERVCKMANAHDFVSRLPKGYETHIGDGGVQLSGGQKQRIAIARTLARNPKVLLLDEATSALDAESESIVQQALDNASVGRTTIMIAHRLSTVRNADKIVVFEKGEILEMGTHDGLIAKGGRYYELVNAQKIEADYTDTVVADVDDEFDSTPAERALGKGSSARSSCALRAERGVDAFRRSVTNNDSHNTFMRCSAAFVMSEQPVATAESEEFAREVQTRNEKDERLVPNLCRVFRAGGWQLLLAVVVAGIRGIELPGITMAFGLVFTSFEFAKTDPWRMQHELVICLIIFCSIGFITFSFQFGASLLFGHAAERVTLDFRVRSLDAILHQDAAYFDNPRHAPGKLITRLATDAPNVKAVMDSRMMSVIYNMTAWVLCVVIALAYAWPVGILGMFMSGSLGVTMVLLARRIQNINVNLIKNNEAGRMSIEIVESVRTIQLLTREKRFLDKYSGASKGLLKSDWLRGRTEAANFALSQSFIYYALAACYALGIHLISIDFLQKDAMYRSVISMLLACIAIMQSSAFFPELVKARTASALLFNIMDRKPSTGDIDAGHKIRLDGRLHFDSVRFAYPQRPHQPILRGLSFTADRGQTVALVGPSGAGKSSVISLLERLYDVAGGSVTFDGMDVRSCSLRSLREQMALVGQEPRLFAGSIRDNVRFGLSREVRDEEIMKALETANAATFVMKMHKGLDTEVGERGTQLSGGQKQRIAIARALIRNPTILLLDEATSALDTESEKMVQEALERAAGGRTCITIAHRLSSIQNAHKIVYIEQGKVLEVGTHAQLIAIKGRYYKLVKRQDMTS
ncbi:hypothetical protein PFISCL1PPCAC_18168 [Pristionchus fissidentatus]|uniref:Uncharacterized protein n=1 Tax=Pristionchus fissidentatus TaxID=1538716 RepID=A0AAV5W7V5_9BILA|nr:hypothetical protein PFISCL1PPCAC_18168 [Pristionchus fissidentatus]